LLFCVGHIDYVPEKLRQLTTLHIGDLHQGVLKAALKQGRRFISGNLRQAAL